VTSNCLAIPSKYERVASGTLRVEVEAVEELVDIVVDDEDPMDGPIKVVM
jgi:hypothetical protein